MTHYYTALTNFWAPYLVCACVRMHVPCRYCCSLASWFCFGHTHMCNRCHREPGRRLQERCTPATCTLRVPHPQPGEEHCLGCGLCWAGAGQ